MAYKKYIKRNGKVYGPYVYHSKRVGGKVISEYRGPQKQKPTKKSKLPYLFLFLFVVVAFIFIIKVFPFGFTGHAISSFNTYSQGNAMSGKFNLVMNPGELIPSNSKVSIVNNGSVHQYDLSQLVTQDQIVSNYYFKGSNIGGNGTGYGFIGKNESYPTVFFKLDLVPLNQTSSGSTPTGTTNQTTGTSSNVTPPTNQTTTNVTSPVNQTSTNETQVTTPTNQTTAVNDTTTTNQTSTSSTSSGTTQTTNETTTQTANTSTTSTTPTTTTTSPVTNTTQQTSASSTTTTTDTTTASAGTTTDTTTTPTTTTTSSGNTTSATPITGNVIGGIFSGIRNLFSSTGRVVSNNVSIQGDVAKGNQFTYNVPTGYSIKVVPSSVYTDTTTLNDSSVSIVMDGSKAIVTTNYSTYNEGFGKPFVTNENKNLVLDFGKVGLNLYPGDLSVNVSYNGSLISRYSGIVSSVPGNVTGNESNVTKLANELFNQTNVTFNISQLSVNLTTSEKAVLKNKFGLIVVMTNATKYRNKIIVSFNIGDYSVSNAYDSSLNKTYLDSLINRDRILWLKDIANQLSSTKNIYTPLSNFSSMDTIN